MRLLRLRLWAARVALSSSGVALPLGAFIVYDAIRNPINHEAIAIYLSTESALGPDPELGYAVRPYSEQRDSSGRTYTTDDRHARIADDDLTNPTEVGRVDFVSVGDSQTFGWGVDTDETFTAVLAKMSGRVGVNLAFSGYSGVNALLMMRRQAHLSPRFIIYGFFEDHLNRNVRPCLESGMPFCTPRPVVAFDDSGPRIQLPEDPVAILRRARFWYAHDGPRIFKDIVAAGQRNWGLLRRRAHEPGRELKIAATLYVLREMKESADRIGAKLIVTYFPIDDLDLNPVPPELLNQEITIIDMTERYREMKASGVATAIAGDGHMTPAVHRAIAEAVLRELQ